jgi:hypothetical protein
MAETDTKRLSVDNFSTVVDLAVGVRPSKSQPAQNVDLARELARWFGQPLSRVPPKLDRKVHPQTTPPEVASKVIEAALNNPVWGCCKLAEELKQQNILISSPTVQKILIKQRIGSRRERAARILELAEQGYALTLKQSLQIKRIMRPKI